MAVAGMPPAPTAPGQPPQAGGPPALAAVPQVERRRIEGFFGSGPKATNSLADAYGDYKAAGLPLDPKSPQAQAFFKHAQRTYGVDLPGQLELWTLPGFYQGKDLGSDLLSALHQAVHGYAPWSDPALTGNKRRGIAADYAAHNEAADFYQKLMPRP